MFRKNTRNVRTISGVNYISLLKLHNGKTVVLTGEKHFHEVPSSMFSTSYQIHRWIKDLVEYNPNYNFTFFIEDTYYLNEENRRLNSNTLDECYKESIMKSITPLLSLADMFCLKNQTEASIKLSKHLPLTDKEINSFRFDRTKSNIDKMKRGVKSSVNDVILSNFTPINLKTVSVDLRKKAIIQISSGGKDVILEIKSPEFRSYKRNLKSTSKIEEDIQFKIKQLTYQFDQNEIIKYWCGINNNEEYFRYFIDNFTDPSIRNFDITTEQLVSDRNKFKEDFDLRIKMEEYSFINIERFINSFLYAYSRNNRSVIMNLSLCQMDIYTILKMLKELETGDSELCIFAGGYYHSKNYYEFLDSYYGGFEASRTFQKDDLEVDMGKYLDVLNFETWFGR